MVFLAINVLLKFDLGLVEDGNGSKIKAPKIGWFNPRPMFGGLTGRPNAPRVVRNLWSYVLARSIWRANHGGGQLILSKEV